MEENEIKEKEKFEEFYSRYTLLLDKEYEELNKEIKKSIIFAIGITVILIAAIVYLVFSDVGKNFISTFLTGTYGVGIICVAALCYVAFMCYVVVRSLKEKRYKISERIITDMVKDISEDGAATYDYGKQTKQSIMEDTDLFDLSKLKYRGENSIIATYHKNPMSFCDVQFYYYVDKESKSYFERDGKKYIRTKRWKEKKNLFSGVYLSARLNKKIADYIYLIPNNIKDIYINGKVLDYINYRGDRLNLENLEFSKKYKVYSEDEVQARYILSLGLMEKINKIDTILPGKKYIVFREGIRFAIFLEDKKIEEVRKCTLPLKRNEEKIKKDFEFMYKEISKLFSIYDILDLGNDIFLDK